MPSSLRSEERRGSEEHTSELQSHDNLECRLLLEKMGKKRYECGNIEGDDCIVRSCSFICKVQLGYAKTFDAWSTLAYFLLLTGRPRKNTIFPKSPLSG